MAAGHARYSAVVRSGRICPGDHGTADTWVVGLGDVSGYAADLRRLVIGDGDGEANHRGIGVGGDAIDCGVTHRGRAHREEFARDKIRGKGANAAGVVTTRI